MIDINSIDKKELFKLVINKLKKEFNTLPESGVLAGQAVASAIYEILEITDKGVYNDLDIFISRFDESEIPFYKKERKSLENVISRLNNFHEIKLSITSPDVYIKFLDQQDKSKIRIYDREFTVNQLYNKLFNKNENKRNPIDKNYIKNLIIDKFECKSLEHDNFYDKTPIPFFSDSELKINYESSFNGLETKIIKKNGYDIISSEVDPYNKRLNYLEISHNIALENNNQKIKNIIDEFDINMCKIGLDFKSGIIEWSDSFELFLKNKEIKCDFYGTAIHTPVRLLKKKRDFNWATLDIESELKNLKNIRKISEILEGDNGYTAGLLYSDVYKERFENEKELSSHYNLVDKVLHHNSNNKFYTLKVKSGYCEKTFDFFNKSINNMKSKNFYFNEIIKDIEKISYLYENPTKKNKAITNFLEKNVNNINSLYELKYLTQMALRKNNNISSINGESIGRILKTAGKHLSLMCMYQDLDIKTLLDISKKVTWLEKRDLGYIVGKIESQEIEKDLLTFGEDDFKKEVKIIDFNFRQKMKNNKRDPLPISLKMRFENKCYVKELSSEYELYIEGSKMKHCVGGYWNDVKNHDSLIYNINIDNSFSTLELKYNTKNKNFEIIQNRSIKNEEPSRSCLEIGEKIKDKLNNDQETINFFENKNKYIQRNPINNIF